MTEQPKRESITVLDALIEERLSIRLDEYIWTTSYYRRITPKPKKIVTKVMATVDATRETAYLGGDREYAFKFPFGAKNIRCTYDIEEG